MSVESLTKEIREYIEGKAQAELEKFEKDAQKKRGVLEKKKNRLLKEAEFVNDMTAVTNIENQFVDDNKVLEEALRSERARIEEKYIPSNWISAAARRARQINIVTHPVKFTHPKIKGATSIYFADGSSRQPSQALKYSVVSTNSISAPEIDIDGNAAALDVAKLLLCGKDAGKTLVEYLKEGNSEPLRGFAETDKQLAAWKKELLKATEGPLSSHKYAKQIYIPIGKGRYHLVSPLFSSTLAHAIFQYVRYIRFSDDMKNARECKKKGKYTSTKVTELLNLALQNFGGTKPQNISLLNTDRHGESYLFNAAPPHWKYRVKPPIRAKTIFSYHYFSKRVWPQVNALRAFLESKLNKGSNLETRARRAKYIDDIIDELLQYSAEIRSMSQFAGWSADPECRMPQEEKLWLDPERTQSDSDFKSEYELGNWRSGVAKRFASWLNQRLSSKKLLLGDVEHLEWRKLLQSKLSEFECEMEALV